MWVFTIDGFYSAVQHNADPGIDPRPSPSRCRLGADVRPATRARLQAGHPAHTEPRLRVPHDPAEGHVGAVPRLRSRGHRLHQLQECRGHAARPRPRRCRTSTCGQRCLTCRRLVSDGTACRHHCCLTVRASPAYCERRDHEVSRQLHAGRVVHQRTQRQHAIASPCQVHQDVELLERQSVFGQVVGEATHDETRRPLQIPPGREADVVSDVGVSAVASSRRCRLRQPRLRGWAS